MVELEGKATAGRLLSAAESSEAVKGRKPESKGSQPVTPRAKPQTKNKAKAQGKAKGKSQGQNEGGSELRERRTSIDAQALVRDVLSSAANEGQFETEKKRSPVVTVIRFLIAFAFLGFILFMKMGEDQWIDETVGSVRLAFDPYEVLGLSRAASAKDIKNAHRELTLSAHPDRQQNGCSPDCQKRFRQISDSYKVLANKSQRTLFDRLGVVRPLDSRSNAFHDDIGEAERLYVPGDYARVIKPSLQGQMTFLTGDQDGANSTPASENDVEVDDVEEGMEKGMEGEGDEEGTATKKAEEDSALLQPSAYALLLVDPKSESTKAILPLWKEMAEAFYGRINFYRVDKALVQELPTKVKFFPAILAISDRNRSPHVFPDVFNFQPRDLIAWLTAYAPSVDPAALKPTLKPRASPESATGEAEHASRPEATILLNPKLPRMPSFLSAYVKMSESVIAWAFESNPEAAANEFDLPEEQLRFNSTAMALIVYRPTLSPLKQESESGVRSSKKAVVIPISPLVWHAEKTMNYRKSDADSDTLLKDTLAAKAATIMTSVLRRITADSRPQLSRENLQYLCKSTGSQKTICSFENNLLAGNNVDKSSSTQRVALPLGFEQEPWVKIAEFDLAASMVRYHGKSDFESISPKLLSAHNLPSFRKRSRFLPFWPWA